MNRYYRVMRMTARLMWLFPHMDEGTAYLIAYDMEDYEND